MDGLGLPQEETIPFPGCISPVDIAVDQVGIAGILKIIVGIFDLLAGLGDLLGNVKIFLVKGQSPVDIFLGCPSTLEQLQMQSPPRISTLYFQYSQKLRIKYLTAIIYL